MGNREGARKSAKPLVVCPNKTLDLSESVEVSTNVRFTGEEVFTLGSVGIDGKDSCIAIEYSTTVRVNGKYVVRDGDKFLVNNKTTGILVYDEGAQKADALQERTTPPDADEGFLDWISDKLSGAVDTAAELNDEYAITTRLEGAVQGVFGLVEVVGGVVGMATPEPLTTAVGAVVFVNGVDNYMAGFSQAWTGQSQQTLTEQAVSATVQAIGVSPETAEMAVLAAGIATNPSKAATKADEVIETAAELAKKRSKAKGKTENYQGEDGLKVTKKKPRTHRVGDCGESIATDELKNEGYDEVVSIKNNSGHGVDVFGRNSRTGEVRVLEVKASESRPGGLSKPQRELGGDLYSTDRLKQALKAKGHWAEKNAPGMKALAKKVQGWLDRAPKVDYEHMQIKIENIDSGCRKKGIKRKPWTKR